ncbi:hypothetical protein GCM10027562_12900 [Arthrobacter pigmenti]
MRGVSSLGELGGGIDVIALIRGSCAECAKGSVELSTYVRFADGAPVSGLRHLRPEDIRSS